MPARRRARDREVRPVSASFHPPVTLEDDQLALRPLALEHVPALAQAGRDPEVWRHLRIGPGRTEAEMRALVERLLEEQATGEVLAFVVERRADARLVGGLRFFHIDRVNRGVEVGTWLSRAVWRTGVNAHAKFLALRYAFESEGVHRVVLKTNSGNERSARAIERLGGTREGVLREHVVAPSGEYTSSIVYSILATEWPQVRARLEARLTRPLAAAAGD
jgi:N-acetyltransferase